jgi:type IV secretory pathway TraG/TraD family ATPase VirD4
MRLRLPEKDRATGRVMAGEALILAAGQPPIYGEQILYFQDPVFTARAALAAPKGCDARPEKSLSAEAHEMAAALLGAGEQV